VIRKFIISLSRVMKSRAQKADFILKVRPTVHI
jgi:hypothetical protein